MTREYSAKDISVLSEIEHIQLNAGMYIGDTNNPVHLIEEALDNALDEALAGHAKIIGVLVDTKNNTCSVLDNGRGIPLGDNTPVTVSTKLFSGAKFQDRKKAYEISSGLHGVGLVAINALSEEYVVEVYRNHQHAIYTFKNAKLKKSTIEKFQGDPPFATKIQFKPNPMYFEKLLPDIDRIRRRLTTASAELPNDLQFVLNIDDKVEVFNLSLLEHFKQSCITSDQFSVQELYTEKKPESFKIIFAYDEEGPLQPSIISSVNLLPVDSGGSHVNCFTDLIRDFFADKAKKFDYKFQPNDSLVRLRAYLILNLIEPKFSGQSKDKLINRKTDFDKQFKDFRDQLDSWASKHEDQLIVLLEKFQDYRRKIDSKKLVGNGDKNKRSSTKFTKLRDCSTRHGQLFIVEGDSAGGSIIQSRDPKIHAILPLKGKSIPNITTKKDILNNKEVKELVIAIGAGVSPHFDIDKMRYDKIVCATDADPDGSHIACLLTMVVGILFPEIIKAGRYFIAQTPLFAINEKKTFIPLWDMKQVEKARKEGRTISRFKGLGELNPSQLKVCLLDEPTRHLIPVEYTGNIDDLIKLFSSADEKRKLVED
jgi:DNA gyrase/topoisomerase IV subunit B